MSDRRQSLWKQILQVNYQQQLHLLVHVRYSLLRHKGIRITATIYRIDIEYSAVDGKYD